MCVCAPPIKRAHAHPQEVAVAREVVERWSNHSGVDTKDLLTRISSTLARYVHFDDKRVYLLVSLWILGTYVYSMFSHYGYLHLHSTKKRSGKTRVLEVSHHLAFEGSHR